MNRIKRETGHGSQAFLKGDTSRALDFEWFGNYITKDLEVLYDGLSKCSSSSDVSISGHLVIELALSK